MGKNVFANGREVSAKADDNKSLAAMPDVCLSPPSPPAGPIPIPYPNFSDASKTTSGSKKVKIGNKEIGLKNKSVYKSSKGDEAATRSFGMGVVTHTLSGATKHAAWSFDVKVEGQNVIRFLDLTTHNHSSDPMNSAAMTLDVAKAKMAAGEPLNCKELSALNEDARKNDVIPSGQDGAMTLTTASRSVKGKNKVLKAISDNSLISQKSDSAFQKKNNRKTSPCKRSQKSGGNMRRNHTEPKLIGPEFKDGGSMTMKIHHQSFLKKDGKIVKPKKLVTDSMPCDQCKAAICAAGLCKPPFEITLCNNNNRKVKPACNKDGTPQPESKWEEKGLGPV